METTTLQPGLVTQSEQVHNPLKGRKHKEIRHHWWVGLMTLVVFGFCGTGLAIAVQAGMTFKYQDSPEILNSVFIYMGSAGRLAEYLYHTNSTRIPSETQRFLADHICVTANAIAYTLVLLAWFLRPRDNHMKRYASSREMNPWHHSHD